MEGGNITYSNRYVDDFFIIYNQTKISPHTLTEHFNAQHKDLQFTINRELNNQITYLDLYLTNRQGQIEMEVYRKPTTHVTINKKSCHPEEHKLSSYRCWIHRLLALPLNKTNRQSELNTILNIALHNGYKKEDIIHIHNKLKYQQNIPNNKTK
jgi:hypothetical protein